MLSIWLVTLCVVVVMVAVVVVLYILDVALNDKSAVVGIVVWPDRTWCYAEYIPTGGWADCIHITVPVRWSHKRTDRFVKTAEEGLWES